MIKTETKNWKVYLLRCSDNSLYCGVTNSLENRLKKHNEGSASKYTRGRLPVEMVAVKRNLTKIEAFKLEYRLKRIPAKKKISFLINNNIKS